MDPHTGDAFRLREELMPTRTGDHIDMELLRAKVALLEEQDEATADEIAAAQREQLVAIEEKVAHRLQLGARELERRARRRKAAKRDRKRNR